MRGSTRGYSPTGSTVVILDSGAIFAGKHLAPHSYYSTTPQVIREVRDQESLRSLEMIMASGKLRIEEPPREAVDRVVLAAERIGLARALSGADISVAALALHYSYSGRRVMVATDDYALQRLLDELGIPWVRARYRGRNVN